MFPASAWWKWDWAFKTILFTALMPFVFRSRIQMEAAVLVILCCIASNVLPFAIKSVFGGGGYGRPFGLIEINGGWGGEGSTLGTYAFACLPLVAYLQRHSLLAPSRSWLRWVYLAAPGIAAIGAFGTFARAAVVACFVWAALAWWQSRRKLMVAVMMVAAPAAIVPLMGDAWLAPFSTSFEPRQDESADTRLLVWAWTIDLANHHPAGAGFNAYLGNRIEMRGEDGGDRPRGPRLPQHLFRGVGRAWLDRPRHLLHHLCRVLPRHAAYPAQGTEQAGSRMAWRSRPRVEPWRTDLHGWRGLRRHCLLPAAILPVRIGGQRLRCVAQPAAPARCRPTPCRADAGPTWRLAPACGAGQALAIAPVRNGASGGRRRIDETAQYLQRLPGALPPAGAHTAALGVLPGIAPLLRKVLRSMRSSLPASPGAR